MRFIKMPFVLGKCAAVLLVPALLIATTAVGQIGFGNPGDRNREMLGGNSTPSTFGWNFGSSAVPNPVNTGTSLDARSFGTTTAVQNFTLGVVVDNSDRGSIVSRVQPGSPAARSGIEVGDTILTVGGFQVGYVENRLFDVGDEIRRRANAQGRVSMLVQDRRSGQIELLAVDLLSTAMVIRGDAILRDRTPIPNGSWLQVRVENITRPYASVSGGTQVFPLTGMQTPFQLSLDSQYLYQGDRFQIQAQIISGNQTLMTTARPVPLDVSSGQSNIRLELVALNNSSANSYSAAYGDRTKAIMDYYQKFLRRSPSQGELFAWEDHINHGRPITDLPTSLLSSPEFYDVSGGGDLQFIDQMFRLAAGRPASQAEINQWRQELQKASGNRLLLAKQFYAALGAR